MNTCSLTVALTMDLHNCKTAITAKLFLILITTLNQMPEDIIHQNIRISGRVQGVGFRYNAREAAFHYGIKGFIRNQPNGDVYIEAEGPRASSG